MKITQTCANNANLVPATSIPLPWLHLHPSTERQQNFCNFSTNLEPESTMDTKRRLDYIQGLPARKEIVEQQAKAVTDLLQCCLKLALSTCATKRTVISKSAGFFQNRKDTKSRLDLYNMVKDNRCIELHLTNPNIRVTRVTRMASARDSGKPKY